MKGLRIAYSPHLGFVEREKIDRDVAVAVEQAVKVFKTLGAKIVEDSPDFQGMDPRKVLNAHWQSNVALLLKGFSPEKRELMDPGLVKAAEFGAQLGQEAVVTAIHQRQAISAIMNQFMAKYDLLLTPTMPMTAFPVNENAAWGGDGVDIGWTPFTLTFNLTRQPPPPSPAASTARACRSACRSSAATPATRSSCAPRQPTSASARSPRRRWRTRSDVTHGASDGPEPPDAPLHPARRGTGRGAGCLGLVRRAAGGAGPDRQARLAALHMAALDRTVPAGRAYSGEDHDVFVWLTLDALGPPGGVCPEGIANDAALERAVDIRILDRASNPSARANASASPT